MRVVVSVYHSIVIVCGASIGSGVVNAVVRVRASCADAAAVRSARCPAASSAVHDIHVYARAITIHGVTALGTTATTKVAPVSLNRCQVTRKGCVPLRIAVALGLPNSRIPGTPTRADASILTDINITGCSGLVVARIIREIIGVAHTTCINACIRYGIG